MAASAVTMQAQKFALVDMEYILKTHHRGSDPL